MGVAQFSSVALSNIQSAVNTINTCTQQIQTATNNISGMQTDLTTVKGQVLTMQNPFSSDSTMSCPSASVYYTVLSITGKGVLYKATGYAATGTAHLKVTVDGAVVYQGGATAGVVGIEQEKDLLDKGTGTYGIRQPKTTTAANITQIGTAPYTADGNVVIILGGPYSYRTSLKIEVMNTAVSNAVDYSYQGGAIQ